MTENSWNFHTVFYSFPKTVGPFWNCQNIMFLTKGAGKNKILTRLKGIWKILTRGKGNKILARAAKPQGQEFFCLPKVKNFLFYLQKGKNFILARPLGQEYYSYKFHFFPSKWLPWINFQSNCWKNSWNWPETSFWRNFCWAFHEIFTGAHC